MLCGIENTEQWIDGHGIVSKTKSFFRFSHLTHHDTP
jgi:hypothetical protein